MSRTLSRRGVRIAVAAFAALVVGVGADAHGDFHDRIGRADQRVAAAPAHPEPLLARADLRADHGDWAGALEDLDRAAELAPGLAEVSYLRGRVLLRAGDPAGAEVALRRFLAAQPDHTRARAVLARSLLQLGRPLDASAERGAVLARDPHPLPDFYYERARALAAAGATHLAEAVDVLDAGLARLGPVAALELYAIDLERRRGAVEEALERLERVASRTGRREGWLARRGEILEEAGRTAEARSAYGDALAALGALPDYHRVTPASRELEARLHAALARTRAQVQP